MEIGFIWSRTRMVAKGNTNGIQQLFESRWMEICTIGCREKEWTKVSTKEISFQEER